MWFKRKKLTIIQRALQEDIRTGDVTTNSLVSRDHMTTAHLISKEAGVFVGIDIIRTILNADIEFFVRDGDYVKKGAVLAVIRGNTRHILTTERVMLNFIRHLSGIATLTRKFVRAAQPATILDTRKTTPGLRRLEKYAVKMGGAENHRMGLYDEVLIKDNHLAIVGDIATAIMKTRKTGKKIVVEVENFIQLKEAVTARPDRILLDNMTISHIKKAVKLADGIPLEVSGNVSLKNVAQIAKTGVNYISVGALTHSAKALDISLRFV